MDNRPKTLREKVSHFITPDRTAPRWMRILPYVTLLALGVLLFIVAGAGWEYTNSSQFCGTACHTMPPEYASYQNSPHSRVKCVECHIGRGYIATQFTRKSGDATHLIRYIGADYEVPIYVKNMRPARDACEKCHDPSKFSDDSLREYKHFDTENNNDLYTTYLSFKTGGGTAREGRGKGIHWHIENKVEYIAVDNPSLSQNIPWVRVTYADNGNEDVFVDVEADLPVDFVQTNESLIKTVDCMTCHNRISHVFNTPEEALDDAMARGLISPEIPYIKKNAIALIERQYPSMDEALKAIDGLKPYYAENWPAFYNGNADLVDDAVAELTGLYQDMVFPTMDITWDTHPDNLGHTESAGCFRCHDGKHLNTDNEAIRLECNLCHSIPLTTQPNGAIDPLPVADAFEPESHSDTKWIARHRFEFDGTCEGCHTVENPGGTDDTSFCANSGCHATELTYAGLNAPQIIESLNTLDGHLPTYPESPLTWKDLVGPILEDRCVACHGAPDGGTAGLRLDTYKRALAGGNFGPAIVPGDPEASLLVKLQQSGHPNSLAPGQLEWITEWIKQGAPEK